MMWWTLPYVTIRVGCCIVVASAVAPVSSFRWTAVYGGLVGFGIVTDVYQSVWRERERREHRGQS